MVVNGEKIFFSSTTLFDKRGGVNLDGGCIFLKKVWREALFATPRPVLGHPPLPCMGGWGQPENSGAEYLYYYQQQPSMSSKPNPISLNKD